MCTLLHMSQIEVFESVMRGNLSHTFMLKTHFHNKHLWPITESLAQYENIVYRSGLFLKDAYQLCDNHRHWITISELFSKQTKRKVQLVQLLLCRSLTGNWAQINKQTKQLRLLYPIFSFLLSSRAHVCLFARCAFIRILFRQAACVSLDGLRGWKQNRLHECNYEKCLL